MAEAGEAEAESSEPDSGAAETKTDVEGAFVAGLADPALTTADYYSLSAGFEEPHRWAFEWLMLEAYPDASGGAHTAGSWFHWVRMRYKY